MQRGGNEEMRTARSPEFEPEAAARLPVVGLVLIASVFLLAVAAPARAALDPEATRPILAAEPFTLLLETGDAGSGERAGEEIEVALLDMGPLLYGIMLAEGDEAGPPPWRRYALMAAGWMGVFVILVALSVASVEMRRQRRRRAWQSRVSGFYD
jgi:hypothetical protein